MQLVVPRTPEFDRISLTPRRGPQDPNAVALLTNWLRSSNGTQNLKPIQAQAFVEMHDHRGLFGPIRVGGGKTLISLLAAVVMGSSSPLLIVPAHLYQKTIREAKILAEHWRVPGFLRILTYQRISHVNGADILEKYQPTDIFLDECHRAKSKKAAVTKRISRYMLAHPETNVVALSGTVSKRSIHDFAHILSWCLKNRMPLPRAWAEIETWASALDERPKAIQRYHPGPILEFCEEEDLKDGDDFTQARRGFRRRLTETPGVVATTETAVDASISINGIIIDAPGMIPHFGKLRTMWETPDGWKLADAMQVWAVARQLALGFHYRWDPKPPDWWLEPRKNWNRFVRHILSTNRRQLDSELQVAQACFQHPEWYGDTEYQAWHAVKKRFKPKKVPTWHDSTAIEYCANWLSDSQPGLCWTEHTGFAQSLSHVTGIPYFGPKGEAPDGTYIEAHVGPAILSKRANTEGRNLQAWSRNLLAFAPTNGLECEQLIGRTHREGQEADEVTFEVLLGCYEHLQAMDQIMRDAAFQEGIGGQEQKLNLADITIPYQTPGGPAWLK